MKIRIREKSHSGPPRIRVREKEVFFCKDCSNKYYSLLLLCPQCLGEVCVTQQQLAALKLVTLPQEKKAEVADSLRSLSGKRSFDFEKSLRNLPWILILETDRAILQHWKEILEALKAEVEIVTVPRKGRRKQPLFESNAPLPFFIPEALRNGARRVSIKIKNTPVQLKWAEAVLLAVNLIESLHKQHALHRLVFSDFILVIERDLQNLIQNAESGFANPQELAVEIEQFRASVQNMRSEVEAVGRQVRDQL